VTPFLLIAILCTQPPQIPMVRVEPGTFVMGADGPTRDHWDEAPAHEVEISRASLISRPEVTVEQFRAFRPDFRTTPGFEPAAAGVSWHDAVAYCAWLTDRTGRPWRLPTEAEWEYACRTNVAENMRTGAREWCYDRYDAYPAGRQVDPVGPGEGLTRVVRGGLLDDRGRLADRTVFDAPSSRASMAPAFGPYDPLPTGAGDDEGGAATEAGLLGTWYAAADLSRPRKRDLMTRLDNNWINDIQRGRDWSARWRGTIEGPHTGPVTFHLSASTGARLRIGGRVVVDAWETGGRRTVTVEMVRGRGEPIEIDYARRSTRDTHLKITWSWPGTAPHVVAEPWITHGARERRLATDDGAGLDLPPGYHAIGFRVVQAPFPDTVPHAPRVPRARADVRRSTERAALGPDPSVPHFRKRHLFPMPPDNATAVEIDAAGLHPSFRGHNHSPALEICPNGDALVVIYTSYREYEPGVSLIASRLRAGADAWDPPDRFLDLATVNDHAPLLWTDHEEGVLYLFWGAPRLIGGFPFQWTTSRDSGATWSPIRFPRFEGAVGPHSRQPINTALRDRDGSFFLSSDGNGGRSVLWVTDDDGVTWHDRGGRTAGRHTTFALLGDGRTILGLGGKNTDLDGWMPRSLSRDGGRTWDVAPTPFPALGTNQRPSLLRLESGRLVFASDYQHFRGHSPMEERGAFVAFSEDDGETWAFRRLDDAQPHEDPTRHGGAATLGYSAMRQAPNGVIHLITTMNRPCLHFEFNEAWLLSDG
jgi:hypothetical protein